MNSRIEQLNRLSTLLDEGKIDRFEYEALKEELLSLQPEPADLSSSLDLLQSVKAALSDVIDNLRLQTFNALGMSGDELAQSEPGRLLLRGVDAFTKGVLAFAILGVAGKAHLQRLLQERPVIGHIAVYVGVTKTVEDICERYTNHPMPYEFRCFMAAFSLIAWQALEEAGISIDPGEEKRPDRIFERLGVLQAESNVTPNADVTFASSVRTSGSSASPDSLEAVVAQVHREMGLSDLPISVGIAAIDAFELLAATGLLTTGGDFDLFRHLVGNLQRSLTRAQRKLLGYSLLNSYPTTAVEYVKRVLVRGIESGILDYPPSVADVVRARPAGT